MNENVLREIIRSIEATYKKKISAALLAADFGYNSELVTKEKIVKKIYAALDEPSEKTKRLYEEWKKMTGKAYSLSGEELQKLAGDYGFDNYKTVDGERLFFAIQTYYSIILKIVSLEIASRFYDSVLEVFLQELIQAKLAGNLKEILKKMESGEYYELYGITNFVEGDVFSWYLEEWGKDMEHIISRIVEKITEYDIESMAENIDEVRDVFKILYEELIPRKEVRKNMGIYTTPDWLAELIVRDIIKSYKRKENIHNKRWLDPGAGTGTFLTIVLREITKIARENGVSDREILEKVTKNVMGFDIDTLAVLTARTNYLIALANLGLLKHKNTNKKLEIPIYLANSMIMAEDLSDTYVPGNGGKPIPIVKIEAGSKIFNIPKKILKNGTILHILRISKEDIYLEKDFKDSTTRKELEKYDLSDGDLEILEDMYNKLLEFKKDGIDDVWIPILKTYLLASYHRDFDFVVGNPPWLSYRYVSDPDYQQQVRNLMIKKYNLVKKAENITHMEMAVLFLARSIDIYLKDKGTLFFVMPKSILYGDQHHNFRMNKINVKYCIEKIYDAEYVTPLFYVPTCAIKVKKKSCPEEKSGKYRREYPAVVIEGKLPEEKYKILSLDESSNCLKFKKKKYYLNEIGNRSFINEHDLGVLNVKSDYYNKFTQGATIVPQTLWVVEIKGERGEIAYVSTSQRATKRAKVRLSVSGNIEKEFLYPLFTSAEILPFTVLKPNRAVLPIKAEGSGYRLIDKNRARDSNKKHLFKWLDYAEKKWKEHRGKKEGKMTIYERLDRNRGLTSQNPKAKYVVVYTSSATHLSAAVINQEEVKKEYHNPPIIDSTLYRFYTDRMDEAYYLLAFFNSPVLDELIKPMQSKGFSGAERHIHKKVLEFPIPKYNSKNKEHRELAKLGKRAEESGREILPNILKDFQFENGKTFTPQEIGRVRSKIREDEDMKSILRDIDGLVIKIMKSASSKFSSTLDDPW